MSGFDSVEHLSTKRKQAISLADKLLWENVEKSIWWRGHKNQTKQERYEEKLKIQFHHWHPVVVAFRISIGDTLQQLEKNEIHEILQYGAARRLRSIYNSVKTICKIAYPDRREVLSEEEKIRLDDALLLFYVHIVGFFDAIAIAFHRSFCGTKTMSENTADLLKKEFRNMVGSEPLKEVIVENNAWFKRIKEQLRNRYVHRVPPYVAPSILSEDEAERYNDLELQKMNALKTQRFDDLDKYRDEQSSIGSFFPYITFTDTNEHMPILSTVLDDVFRFQTIALIVFEELLPNLKIANS